jgi:hypothetical protein
MKNSPQTQILSPIISKIVKEEGKIFVRGKLQLPKGSIFSPHPAEGFGGKRAFLCKNSEWIPSD